MATLGEIESSAEGIIKDLNADVLAEITGFVNRSQRELEDNYLSDDQQSDITLRTGTGSPVFDGVHDLDTLFMRLGGTPFRVQYTQDDTITEDVTILDLRQLSGDQQRFARRATTDGERDIPRYYWLKGSVFSIYPYPDTNGEYFGAYTIRIPIWSRLAALSSASDTNWFTDNCQDYMIWRTAELGLEFNRDPMSAVYGQRAMTERKRLKRWRNREIFGHRFGINPTSASELSSRSGHYGSRRVFNIGDWEIGKP